MPPMNQFENLFFDYMKQICDENPDPSHDILHVQRVVALAKKLGKEENAKLEVIVPAAYLHDCVYISKADARRSMASRISAEKAGELLLAWNYPQAHHLEIQHAICAHSFSARIAPETLEAKIVQDADRLDGIGAIGIFRCFAFSGLARRPLYWQDDPFCKKRKPDDRHNTLDHFYTKLLGLCESLHTASAKAEGSKRLHTMQAYLEALERELEF
jgi:uncharacterized protein